VVYLSSKKKEEALVLQDDVGREKKSITLSKKKEKRDALPVGLGPDFYLLPGASKSPAKRKRGPWASEGKPISWLDLERGKGKGLFPFYIIKKGREPLSNWKNREFRLRCSPRKKKKRNKGVYFGLVGLARRKKKKKKKKATSTISRRKGR